MYSNKKYKKTLVILIKKEKKILEFSPLRHSRNQEINAPVVVVVAVS